MPKMKSRVMGEGINCLKQIILIYSGLTSLYRRKLYRVEADYIDSVDVRDVNVEVIMMPKYLFHCPSNDS